MTRLDMLINWIQRNRGWDVGERDLLVRVLKPLMTAVGDVFGDADYAGVLTYPWEAEFHHDATGRQQSDAMERSLMLLGPVAVAVLGKHPEVLDGVREGLKEIGCDKAFMSEFWRNRGGGRLLTAAQQHVARSVRAHARELAASTPEETAALTEQWAGEAAKEIVAESVTRAATDWQQLGELELVDYQVVLDQARAAVATLGAASTAASKVVVSQDVAAAEKALLKRIQRGGGSILTPAGRVHLAVTLLVPINQPEPPAWLPEPIASAWRDFEDHARGYASVVARRVPEQDRADVVGDAVMTTQKRLRSRFIDVFVGARPSPEDEDGLTWEKYWKRVLGKVTRGEVSKYWVRVGPPGPVSPGSGGSTGEPGDAVLVGKGRGALQESGVWDEVCASEPPRSWCVAAAGLVEVADGEHQLLKGLPKKDGASAEEQERLRSVLVAKLVAAVGAWLGNDLPERLSGFLLPGGNPGGGPADVIGWCEEALTSRFAGNPDVVVVAGVGGRLAAAAFALAVAVLSGTDPYALTGDPQ